MSTNTENPCLLYDATVVLEFEPDGNQVLKVAISDAVEPFLINKHGHRIIDGPALEGYVKRADRWLKIDYTIATHKEDPPEDRLKKMLVDMIDARFHEQRLDPVSLSIIKAYAEEIIELVREANEIERSNT